MKKLNTNAYGGKLLPAAILLLVIPAVILLCLKRFLWWALLPGELALAVYLTLRIVETAQDRAARKAGHDPEKIPFDPSAQRAVIRASICTGEQVAGFRDLATGHFTEVAVLKSEADKEAFMKAYGLTDIKTEY